VLSVDLRGDDVDQRVPEHRIGDRDYAWSVGRIVSRMPSI
jgi:hypothetical protein